MRRSPRFLVTARLPLAISDLEAGASFMDDVMDSSGCMQWFDDYWSSALWMDLGTPCGAGRDLRWTSLSTTVDNLFEAVINLTSDQGKRLSTGCVQKKVWAILKDCLLGRLGNQRRRVCSLPAGVVRGGMQGERRSRLRAARCPKGSPRRCSARCCCARSAA